MQRRDRQSCGAIRANEVANWAFDAQVEKSKLWRIFVPRYQSGACSSNDVKQQGGQINLGCMWVLGAVRYYFVLLQKQEYILQRDWSCLAEAPPMTRIHVCLKNSKCSSVQLLAIYSLLSRLVWTHLEADTIRISMHSQRYDTLKIHMKQLPIWSGSPLLRCSFDSMQWRSRLTIS